VFRRTRDLALFDLGIDTKLRACDLIRLKSATSATATASPRRPSSCDKGPLDRCSSRSPADARGRGRLDQGGSPEDFLFPSRLHESPHLGTRQYARIVDASVEEIGLDKAAYRTHWVHRTKASLIYRQTKNPRAVQPLLAHTKFESTVRCLGIEVDDALELTEQTEV
jgi:integrase